MIRELPGDVVTNTVGDESDVGSRTWSKSLPGRADSSSTRRTGPDSRKRESNAPGHPLAAPVRPASPTAARHLSLSPCSHKGVLSVLPDAQPASRPSNLENLSLIFVV